MRAVKQWRVDIFIGEDDGSTYAEARLVTEIGDEIAAARALRALGTNVLDTASSDIEGVTGEDVHLTR